MSFQLCSRFSFPIFLFVSQERKYVLYVERNDEEDAVHIFFTLNRKEKKQEQWLT